MEQILQRFLDYVIIDTEAVEGAAEIPSSPGQRVLAEKLAAELQEMGVADVRVDEHACVTGKIPSNLKGGHAVPAIGFLAHLDTAPEFCGKDVHPKIHEDYDGGTLTIDEAAGIVLTPEENPALLRYVGDTIVTSDGSTLLGADDKAGIAVIMDMAGRLCSCPEIRHGDVCIAFTPDEEVSEGGAAIFDIEGFGADFAYTVDGDGIGEFNCETFNAAEAEVTFTGISIHTGAAKGRMVNPLQLASRYMSAIPAEESPEHTEGYEGFYHVYGFDGDTDSAQIRLILRDFEKEGLNKRLQLLSDLAEIINREYGKNFVTLESKPEYSNMRDFLKGRDEIIETALSAYRRCGLEPEIVPVRGGTDGSTLSERGLPTPNIFIGGHNYHSAFEFVSVNAMKKASDILICILELFAGKAEEPGKK